MKLNKIQVAIIWISLSILIPVSYFALKEVSEQNFSMKVWRGIEKGEWKVDTHQPTTEQQEIDNGYRANKEKRDRAIEVFGVFAFELLSLTGLTVYLTHKRTLP